MLLYYIISVAVTVMAVTVMTVAVTVMTVARQNVQVVIILFASHATRIVNYAHSVTLGVKMIVNVKC